MKIDHCRRQSGMVTHIQARLEIAGGDDFAAGSTQGVDMQRDKKLVLDDEDKSPSKATS